MRRSTFLGGGARTRSRKEEGVKRRHLNENCGGDPSARLSIFHKHCPASVTMMMRNPINAFRTALTTTATVPRRRALAVVAVQRDDAATIHHRHEEEILDNRHRPQSRQRRRRRRRRRSFVLPPRRRSRTPSGVVSTIGDPLLVSHLLAPEEIAVRESASSFCRCRAPNYSPRYSWPIVTRYTSTGTT